MDFKPSEQQEVLRNVARAFLSREFPLSRLREIEERGLGDFQTVYRKMGELGFLGIGIPEEYGGSGGTWLDVVIFNEEAGRALIPTVHVSSMTLAGHAVRLSPAEEAARSALLEAALAAGLGRGREPCPTGGPRLSCHRYLQPDERLQRAADAGRAGVCQAA